MKGFENVAEFKREFRLASDKGDMWGESTAAHFECAAHIVLREQSPVPKNWGYKQGCYNQFKGRDDRDTDNHYHTLFDNTSTKVLIEIGNLLSRYEDYLEYKGLSY